MLMDTLWPVAATNFHRNASADADHFPPKGTLQPALEPDIGGKPQPGPPIGAMAPRAKPASKMLVPTELIINKAHLSSHTWL
jgi:hypothetical protein